jgi:hypothetical protein
MKKVALAIGACLGGLALAGGAAAATYEMTVVPGTPASNAGTFRVNTTTGEVDQAWGAATQFSALPESAPLPAGAYHIQAPTWIDSAGKVSWCLYRIDQASGRIWYATGGGAAPLTWVEITAPK